MLLLASIVLVSPSLSPSVPQDAGPALAPERPPLPADEWYLAASDGKCRLFVREYGAGDPIVVLHGGWGAEHSYLLDAIWSQRGSNRFLLYDQRGSLRSPAELDTISIARHVQDLEDLRRELGLESLSLFAHSMGGFLALSYADAHPGRVERMVLTGSIPPRHTGEEAPFGAWNDRSNAMVSRPRVAEVLRREGLAEGALDDRRATHAWRVRFAAVNTVHVERWRQFRGGNAFYASEAGSRAARDMPDRWDFPNLFRDQGFPVTVLVGDSDYVDPGGEVWKDATGDYPCVLVLALEDAGHAAWIDRPVEFAGQLAEALR